jgi:hypothetical protein
MITVTHILADAEFGGVTRFLDALEARLGPGIRHRRCIVNPRSVMPPDMSDDIVIVHYTMGWIEHDAGGGRWC